MSRKINNRSITSKSRNVDRCSIINAKFLNHISTSYYFVFYLAFNFDTTPSLDTSWPKHAISCRICRRCCWFCLQNKRCCNCYPWCRIFYFVDEIIFFPVKLLALELCDSVKNDDTSDSNTFAFNFKAILP